jgi:hypothetical protein
MPFPIRAVQATVAKKKGHDHQVKCAGDRRQHLENKVQSPYKISSSALVETEWTCVQSPGFLFWPNLLETR